MHVMEWSVERIHVSFCHVHFSMFQSNSRTLKYVHRNKAAATPVSVIILARCHNKQEYMI
jgi:hypothetical protein